MDIYEFLNEFYSELEKQTSTNYSNKIQKLIEGNNCIEEEIIKLIKEEL